MSASARFMTVLRWPLHRSPRGGSRSRALGLAILLTAVVTPGLAACGDDDDERPATTEATTTPVPPPPEPPAPSGPSAEEVPIAEDYADEAEAEVDDATYRRQLEELATEIEADLAG